jgi:hypothetical protein
MRSREPALRQLLIQQTKLTSALAGEFGLSPGRRDRVAGERTTPPKPSGWDQLS